MSSKRIKVAGPAIKSREEMEALVRKTASGKIEEQALKAAMDAAVTSTPSAKPA